MDRPFNQFRREAYIENVQLHRAVNEEAAAVRGANGKVVLILSSEIQRSRNAQNTGVSRNGKKPAMVVEEREGVAVAVIRIAGHRHSAEHRADGGVLGH